MENGINEKRSTLKNKEKLLQVDVTNIEENHFDDRRDSDDLMNQKNQSSPQSCSSVSPPSSNYLKFPSKDDNWKFISSSSVIGKNKNLGNLLSSVVGGSIACSSSGLLSKRDTSENKKNTYPLRKKLKSKGTNGDACESNTSDGFFPILTIPYKDETPSVLACIPKPTEIDSNMMDLIEEQKKKLLMKQNRFYQSMILLGKKQKSNAAGTLNSKVKEQTSPENQLGTFNEHITKKNNENDKKQEWSIEDKMRPVLCLNDVLWNSMMNDWMCLSISVDSYFEIYSIEAELIGRNKVSNLLDCMLLERNSISFGSYVQINDPGEGASDTVKQEQVNSIVAQKSYWTSDIYEDFSNILLLSIHLNCMQRQAMKESAMRMYYEQCHPLLVKYRVFEKDFLNYIDSIPISTDKMMFENEQMYTKDSNEQIEIKKQDRKYNLMASLTQLAFFLASEDTTASTKIAQDLLNISEKMLSKVDIAKTKTRIDYKEMFGRVNYIKHLNTQVNAVLNDMKLGKLIETMRRANIYEVEVQDSFELNSVPELPPPNSRLSPKNVQKIEKFLYFMRQNFNFMTVIDKSLNNVIKYKILVTIFTLISNLLLIQVNDMKECSSDQFSNEAKHVKHDCANEIAECVITNFELIQHCPIPLVFAVVRSAQILLEYNKLEYVQILLESIKTFQERGGVVQRRFKTILQTLKDTFQQKTKEKQSARILVQNLRDLKYNVLPQTYMNVNSKNFKDEDNVETSNIIVQDSQTNLSNHSHAIPNNSYKTSGRGDESGGFYLKDGTDGSKYVQQHNKEKDSSKKRKREEEGTVVEGFDFDYLMDEDWEENDFLKEILEKSKEEYKEQVQNQKKEEQVQEELNFDKVSFETSDCFSTTDFLDSENTDSALFDF